MQNDKPATLKDFLFLLWAFENILILLNHLFYAMIVQIHYQRYF